MIHRFQSVETRKDNYNEYSYRFDITNDEYLKAVVKMWNSLNRLTPDNKSNVNKDEEAKDQDGANDTGVTGDEESDLPF